VTIGPPTPPVVVTALQLAIGVAWAGPRWMGLQPGKAGRSEIAESWSVSEGQIIQANQRTFAFSSLVNGGLLSALVDVSVGLDGQCTALFRDTVDIRALIHGALKGIAFPAKHVVAMMAITSSRGIPVSTSTL
jgi:hypothetical protein